MSVHVDGSASGDPTGNDTLRSWTTQDGQTHDPIASFSSGPSHGSLSSGEGSGLPFTYTPDAGYIGSDSFSYSIYDEPGGWCEQAEEDGSCSGDNWHANDDDGTYGWSGATVNIDVTNAAPAVSGGSFSTDEDQTLDGSVSASDPDGDPITLSVTSGPSNGGVSLNDDGSFTYTPNPGYSGDDSFSFHAYDTYDYSDDATVTITVTPPPAPPTANDDTLSTSTDSPASGNVLGNDSYATSASLDGGASHGSVDFSADGSFTYTPDPGFRGYDGFSYTAINAVGTAGAGVTILVDNGPTAGDGSAATDEDTPCTIWPIDSASDPDGDDLSVIIVSGPTNGSLSVNPDGSVTYTPAHDYNGSDSFSYQVSDGWLTSDPANVTITIDPVDDAPSANDDSYVVDPVADGTLNVPAPGVLGNDTDVDSPSLQAELVSGPAHGTLTLNSDGSFTYTPDANFHGIDSFVYIATDGDQSGQATTCVISNQAPTPQNDAWPTDEDTPLIVAAPGLLINDTDPEGDPLFASFLHTNHGSVDLSADGGFTYTPNANFSGTDSLTYESCDDYHCTTATATITVNAINDAPVLSGSANFSTINEDNVISSGNLVSTLLSGHVTDADTADPRGIAITALNTGNGIWQYQLNGDSTWTDVGDVSETAALLLRSTDRLRLVPDTYNGTTASVTFRAWDQTSGTAATKVDVSNSGGATAFSTATATANLTVASINDAPILTGANDFPSIDEHDTTNTGELVSTLLAGHVTDPDNGALQGIAIDSISGNGTWQYRLQGDTAWTNVLSVSDASALLLRSQDSLRLLPYMCFTTTATATFRAWDQTTGAAGTKVNASNSGGTTPFSSATATSSIEVTSADVAIDQFTSDGVSVNIDYTVIGTIRHSYSIAVYASPDGINPAQQVWRGDGGTDAGSHTFTFQPEYDDWQDDYYLIATADPDNYLAETSEYNSIAFSGGMFITNEHASGKHVFQIQGHAGNFDDIATITQIGSTLRATFGGLIHDYSPAAIDEIHFRGHGGNDSLTGLATLTNPMWLFGGDGNDELYADDGSDFVFGGAGIDQLDGGGGDDNILGGDGDDELIGNGGNDFLSGGAGNDLFFGDQTGPDGVDYILTGQPGNDTLHGGDGNDEAHGGDGNDTIDGENGDDTIDGDGGDDSLDGGNDDDSINGDDGDDAISGGDGNDTLDGGNGNDAIDGGAGTNVVTSGEQQSGSNWYTDENGVSWYIGPRDLNGNPCIFTPDPGYEWLTRPAIPYPQSDRDGLTQTIELYRDFPWRYANDIQVRIDVIDGTAVNGVDFDAPTSTVVTLPNSLNDPYHDPVWPTFTITWLPDNDGVIEDTQKTFTIQYTTLEKEPCGWISSNEVTAWDQTVIATDDDATLVPNTSVPVSPLENDLSGRMPFSPNFYPISIESFGQPSHGHVERDEANPDILIYTPDPTDPDDEIVDDQFEYTATNGKQTSTAFVYLFIDRPVNLTIFDGQTGKDGGNIVQEPDENVTGAVTVANMNDTDADGRIDNVDYPGGPNGGNGVEQTAANQGGRNEVDLMKLIVHKPVPYNGGSVVLTITPGARVGLWGDSNKKTPIDATYTLGSNTATWPQWGPGGDRTIWVEITTASTTVGDVQLKLEYGNATPDIVIATGVWATRTDQIFSTTNWNQLAGTVWQTDMDPSLQNQIANDPALGGIGKRPEAQVVIDGKPGVSAFNVMAMQFTVTPANVETILPRVKFDITRRKELKEWITTTTMAAPGLNTWHQVPSMREIPTDDQGNIDESDRVNNLGRMYVIDNPGPVGARPTNGGRLKTWLKQNFVEWVRVAFTGRPDANAVMRPPQPPLQLGTIFGSATSPFYKWSSESTIQWVGPEGNPQYWNRTDVGGNNRIVDGVWTSLNLP